MFENVDVLVAEGGIVERGRVPDGEGSDADDPCDRPPREDSLDPGKHPDAQHAAQCLHRQPGEQERRHDQHQEQVLEHVGREEIVVGQNVERGDEREQQDGHAHQEPGAHATDLPAGQGHVAQHQADAAQHDRRLEIPRA